MSEGDSQVTYAAAIVIVGGEGLVGCGPVRRWIWPKSICVDFGVMRVGLAGNWKVVVLDFFCY
jgi:hypothetical protein